LTLLFFFLNSSKILSAVTGRWVVLIRYVDGAMGDDDVWQMAFTV